MLSLQTDSLIYFQCERVLLNSYKAPQLSQTSSFRSVSWHKGKYDVLCKTSSAAEERKALQEVKASDQEKVDPTVSKKFF